MKSIIKPSYWVLTLTRAGHLPSRSVRGIVILRESKVFQVSNHRKVDFAPRRRMIPDCLEVRARVQVVTPRRRMIPDSLEVRDRVQVVLSDQGWGALFLGTRNTTRDPETVMA